MKNIFLRSTLFSVIAITLIQTACLSPRDRIGGRVAIDHGARTATPLNKEACLYLAYEALCKNNLKEAFGQIPK